VADRGESLQAGDIALGEYLCDKPRLRRNLDAIVAADSDASTLLASMLQCE
jgi:hypothetical protein